MERSTCPQDFEVPPEYSPGSPVWSKFSGSGSAALPVLLRPRKATMSGRDAEVLKGDLHKSPRKVSPRASLYVSPDDAVEGHLQVGNFLLLSGSGTASGADHLGFFDILDSAQPAFERQVSVTEWDTLLAQSREKMRQRYRVSGRLANRYGSMAYLPPFVPGEHVPTLALLNPHSGAEAGRDILEIAGSQPYYQDRFFNILDVVKDQYRGGLLDLFRIELNSAKEEAKALGVRARVVSGGGDGTASFALFIILVALKADPSRAEEGLADTGNGFIWTDRELEECFPALAQLPLGSANDFGHTLGWGRKYPGDQFFNIGSHQRNAAAQALQDWFKVAMEPKTAVVNFDVWGIMPRPGERACEFKVCDLAGPRGHDPKVLRDGKKHLMMKESRTPVPLFVCLYFSAGFGAYMTSRFQINRRKQPLTNKMEYVRQAVGIVCESCPPQLNRNLGGVTVTCRGQQYFPPRRNGKEGAEKYREVGFLNINWQAGVAHGADRAPVCGRVCATREPAKFNDGKMDMFRLKLSSPLRNPRLVYQTDKKDGTMTLNFDGGKGKGLFFQWDGEARFAFSPSGEPFNINIRKVLNIPVVLGPQYDARVAGDPFMHDQVTFRFCGETPQARFESRERILRYVRGDLNEELNASWGEMKAAGLLSSEEVFRAATQPVG